MDEPHSEQRVEAAQPEEAGPVPAAPAVPARGRRARGPRHLQDPRSPAAGARRGGGGRRAARAPRRRAHRRGPGGWPRAAASSPAASSSPARVEGAGGRRADRGRVEVLGVLVLRQLAEDEVQGRGEPRPARRELDAAGHAGSRGRGGPPGSIRTRTACGAPGSRGRRGPPHQQLEGTEHARGAAHTPSPAWREMPMPAGTVGSIEARRARQKRPHFHFVSPIFLRHKDMEIRER